LNDNGAQIGSTSWGLTASAEGTGTMTLPALVMGELRGKAIPDLIVAILFGVLSLLHLFLMFVVGMWLGPFALWFAAPLPSYGPLLCGVFFVAILCLSALWFDYRYWTSLTYDSKSLGEIRLADAPLIMHSIGPYRGMFGSLGLGGMGLPADMNVLGPASIGLLTKIICLPLLLGPLLLLGALRGLRESRRLLAMDGERLAKILAFILSKGGRASFRDLKDAFPDLSAETDVKALVLIEGVVILHKEMQGIALTDELKQRIRDTAPEAGIDAT
jgi:hypothetical protein